MVATTTIAQARSRLARARLYCITPDWPPARLEGFADQVLAGGAEILQLRHKSLARGDLLALARRLAGVCHRRGALLIVNDYVDIALLSGADGVHLGPDDLEVAEARRLAPLLLIGASAWTPKAAAAAERAGADYIGCGPFRPTATKPGKEAIGPGGIRAVIDAVDIPVFVIGGIKQSDVPELRACGIERICVISALSDAQDPAGEARLLRAQLR